MRYILASASPRRREILDIAGIKYSISVPDVSEEIAEGIDAESAVKILSLRKAQAVERSFGDVVIAADTVVTLDGIIFGKPANQTQAFDMLRRLSGRIHNVFTGVTVLSDYKTDSFAVKTDVEFYELEDAFIREYIDTCNPLDKAGAYGIQDRGCLMIKSICGDYYNVVGLPVSELIRHLP